MSSVPLPAVVSDAWLADRLQTPGLVVLDASWYLPAMARDARAEYAAGHIPGARFFDLDAASDPQTSLPHMLASDEAFGAYVGALGIGNDDTVVVYDGSGMNLSAARVWWMFQAYGHERVAVLDGGAKQWRAAGRPFVADVPVVAPRTFVAKLDRSRVCDLAEVEAAIGDAGLQIVDMRASGRFEGRDPEPRPELPSGHMAGARNLPFAELVGPDGRLLSPDVLRQRIARAGVVLERPIIATCGSGTSACVLLLALEHMGAAAAAKLYDGSWTQWAGAGRPIVTGPAG
jgi:thiosulfate/3-mercaptopyruvate sulfurtransferase